MSKFGRELIESMQEAVEYAKGRKPPGMRVTIVPLPDVKAIRRSLRMSQQRFAVTYHIPLSTLKTGSRVAARPMRRPPPISWRSSAAPRKSWKRLPADGEGLFKSEIELPDLAATEALGAWIAARLRVGDAVALEGDLGAGRRGAGAGHIDGAGVTEDVPSPTFTLVQVYETPRPRGQPFRSLSHQERKRTGRARFRRGAGLRRVADRVAGARTAPHSGGCAACGALGPGRCASRGAVRTENLNPGIGAIHGV